MLIAGAGIVAASLWIFFSISDQVLKHESYGLVNKIMLAMHVPGDLGHLIGPQWVQSACVNVTALGSAPVLKLIALLVIGYLFMERKIGVAPR